MRWMPLALLLLAGAAAGDEPACGELPACEQACEEGDLAVCTELAALLAQGDGDEADPARSIALYTKACEGGVGASCLGLGRCYLDGSGLDRDPAAAVDLFEKACQASDGRGCAELGSLASQGVGLERDVERAGRSFARGCKLGDVGACLEYAFLLESGYGIERDRARADRLFTEMCDDEMATACIAKAVLMDDTAHMPDDVELDLVVTSKARRSCARSDGGGCYLLALTFRDIGYAPQAVRMLFKACDAGHGTSCQELARRFREGDGVLLDESRAAELEKRRRGGNSVTP